MFYFYKGCTYLTFSTLMSMSKQAFFKILMIPGIGIYSYKWFKFIDFAHSVNKLVRCKIGEGRKSIFLEISNQAFFVSRPEVP